MCWMGFGVMEVLCTSYPSQCRVCDCSRCWRARAQALLSNAQLPTRVAVSAAANAAEEAKPRGVRRGYMGHLIAIG
jgi:hypothetical protein